MTCDCCGSDREDCACICRTWIDVGYFRCTNCKQEAPVKDWFGWVPCELCGTHDWFKCPSCGQRTADYDEAKPRIVWRD